YLVEYAVAVERVGDELTAHYELNCAPKNIARVPFHPGVRDWVETNYHGQYCEARNVGGFVGKVFARARYSEEIPLNLRRNVVGDFDLCTAMNNVTLSDSSLLNGVRQLVGDEFLSTGALR